MEHLSNASNINLGAMSVAEEIPLMSEENQNLMHGEVNFGQNFDFASSFLQDPFMNNELPAPLLDNANPKVNEEGMLPSLAKDDAHSDNEIPEEQPTNNKKRSSRKQYQRHTPEQIGGMEALFKTCPHPDEKQRRELGHQLGLSPFQVKFWFQNKRTSTKTYQERRESTQLRAEKERLQAENKELKKRMPLSAACRICGNACIPVVPINEDNLKSENKKLKGKIQHIKALATHVFGYLPDSFFNQGTPEYKGQLDNIPPRVTVSDSQSFRSFNGLHELDKKIVIELANSAMDEVTIMALTGEPIWIPNFQRNTNVLNEQEYLRTFQRGFAPKKVGFKSEASRESEIVIMSPHNILEIFMELNKWLAIFSGMVSKAMLLENISTGAEGNYNGSMQLISAEFHVLSPAVPTRDCVFVRYCKQLNEGTWAVADVSVDDIFPKGQMAKCHKRPSGCIIQAMPNGCSQITWVENIEAQDDSMHTIASSFINTGEAYGAKRWISILRRQCERLASAMGNANFPYVEDHTEIVQSNPEGRKNLLKLAERMVLSFSNSVTSSTGTNQWTKVSGDGVDEVKIMTRKSFNEPGRPSGLLLSASICFWIPVLPKIVFDYLRSDITRAEWDVLSIGGGVKEIAYMGNGQETGNGVSIFRVKGASQGQGNMLIVQESSCGSTTSYIVYAPVDGFAANMLYKGGNPENIQLLPSGFTILPCHPPCHDEHLEETITIGTLLSVAFQVLVGPDPFAKLSIASTATVNNLIDSTIDKIKNALRPFYY